LDRNHDGVINDGSELFGSSTVLGNGQRAKDGYVALSEMDTNGDGLITSADKGFADLRVWIDSNSDGISQSGELKTLDTLGINKLGVNAQSTSVNSNGNWIGLASNYQTTDGANHAMADVWFVAEKAGQASNLATNQATNQTSTAQATAGTDLRTQVNGLVQAIASFGVSSGMPVTGQGTTTSLTAPGTSTTQAVSTNMGGIVDTLRQFDANGNPLVASGSMGVGIQPTNATGLVTSPDTSKTGFLVSGK
jgi:hypothetical protein